MRKILVVLAALALLGASADPGRFPIDIVDIADNTDGEIPTWDANGVATTFGPGTANQYVASQGVGAEPIFKSILDEDDMVSDSATDVASQQSIKAFVTSGTITMSAKTLTSPVLNGTITGDAFLDEDNMVSDSAVKLASQQSIKKYVDDNAGATKEFMVLPHAQGGVLGHWIYDESNDTGQTFFVFVVLNDFSSLTEAVVVIIPDATETVQWDLSTSVAAAGEDYNGDDRQALNETKSVTVNDLTELDVSGQLTGLAAGDYVAVHFESDTPTLRIIGLRIRYN